MITTRKQVTLGAGAVAEAGGATDWTNESNALTEDNNYGSATSGPGGGGFTPADLHFDEFGFNLPSSAIILGIEVEIDCKRYGVAGTDTINIRYNGGTTGAGTDSQDWPTSRDVITYGGNEELWGKSDWTAADINHDDFGVTTNYMHGSSSASQEIYYVAVTVYWDLDFTADAAEVQKYYDYKVFNADQEYLGNLMNVTSDFSLPQEINTVGSPLTIDAAVNPDAQVPTIGLGNIVSWLSEDWNYRVKLTVNRDSLNADLADFAVLVDLSDLPKHFFDNVDTNGDDIRVTTSYGTKEVPFELVSIDTTNRTGELWFLTDLDVDIDNDFFIYYGNATASAYAADDIYGSENVWPSYGGVWHLEDLTDSTANGNDGTAEGSLPSASTQKIGKGYDFELSTNDRIDIGNDSSITPTNAPISISMWVKPESLATTMNLFGTSDWQDVQANYSGFKVDIDSNQKFSSSNGDNAGSSAANRRTFTGDTTVTTDTWYYLVIEWINNANCDIYVNGQIETMTGGGTSSSVANAAVNAHIGAASETNGFDGELDEVRLRTARLDSPFERIATEYENQSDPSSFYTVSEFEEYVDYDSVLLKNGNHVEVWETSYYYPNGKLRYRGQINQLEATFDPQATGIVRAILQSDGRDTDNIVARGAPFSYTADVTQEVSDRYVNIYEIPATSKSNEQWKRMGQTWIAGADNLGKVQLRLRGTADVTVSIYDNNSLSNLLGEVTKYVSTNGYAHVSFIFDFIELEVGEEYFMTVKVGSGQAIHLKYNNSSVYANGTLWQSHNTGTGAYFDTEFTTKDLHFTTYYGTPSTQGVYTSDDPTADMLTAILDDYADQGGALIYEDGDIESTGLSLSYTFNVATVYEAIEKILELSPSGYYYYTDLGLNRLYFKETNTTPDVIFTKGRHIQELKLNFSITEVVNKVLFSGGDTGGGDNLYSSYDQPESKAQYGTRLERKSDNRVTVQATADRMSERIIAEHKAEQYSTEVVILDRTMDITTLNVGMTVGLRGYGNFLDRLTMQIIRIVYESDKAILTLGTMPRRFNTEVEKTIRGLLAEQTLHNPSEPT